MWHTYSKDSRGVTVYDYDVLGRMTKVNYPDDRWIAYEYDLNNNRTKMTVHVNSTTEHVTKYCYYDRGLLHEVTDQLDGVTHYTYKDNGLVDTITYPNSTQAVHSYNSRNWLTELENKKSNNTVIAKFTYSYDTTSWGKNGTRTRVIEDILKPNGNNRISAQVDYGYDDKYRLTHEHRVAYNSGDPGVAYEYNYVYDAAGNRTSKQVVGGSTTNYTYDAANKLTSAGGTTTYSYDNKGNITNIVVSGGATTTYTWNHLNRMTQWAKTGQTTLSYDYDMYGMRFKTTSGGTATNFMLDWNEVAEEITGASVKSYVGPGLLSQISGTTHIVSHADVLGNIRATSNDSGGVASTNIYDAFGNNLSGNLLNFGYAGKYRYYSDSTGLQYVKNRYYDSAAGRFISRDPIGYSNKSGINLYEYVYNNPVNGVDPSGLLCIPISTCHITNPDTIGSWADTVWGLCTTRFPTPGLVCFGSAMYDYYDKGRMKLRCFGLRTIGIIIGGTRCYRNGTVQVPYTWDVWIDCMNIRRDYIAVTGDLWDVLYRREGTRFGP